MRQGRPVSEDFCYASDTNEAWLDVEELRRIVGARAEPEPGDWIERPKTRAKPARQSPGKELR